MLQLQDFINPTEKSDDALNETILGNESFNYTRFRLNYHLWKIAYLNSNFINLSDLQLPWDSIYHTFDNLDYGTTNDTPEVTKDPLIVNESYRKWIMHITSFDLSSPIKMDEKYIYVVSALKTNLLSFRAQYKNEFRYIDNIASIMPKKETFTIVNYNPLFRAYTYGMLRYYKKMMLLFTTVLNTVAKMHDRYPNKHHYISIPWDTNTFSRDQFIRSKMKLDNTSIKYPMNFHYIFMMHLLNFLDDSPTSIFNDYPQVYWEDTNFVLHIKDKCTIINLKDIKEMNVDNRMYIKIVNHLNTLSLFGIGSTNKEIKTVTSNNAADVWNDSIPVITSTEPAISLDGLTKDKVIDQEVKPTIETPIPITKPVEVVNNTNTTVVTDTKQVISKNILPIVHPIAPNLTTISKVDSAAGPTITSQPKLVTSRSIVPFMAANITHVNATTDIKTVENNALAYIDEIDQTAKTYIDAQEDLTPKQKQRLQTLATKYKTLTIGDESLSDIILNNNDVSIEKAISEDISENLPDPSMAKSSVMQFNDSYVRKTQKKDLAMVVTSFNKNGMFLVDSKSDTVLNELTHATHHVFNYEDKNGKKHKIEFSVPVVDPDGYCYINGVKKLLKKQMVNIPICKISENKVAMASYYNKVLVIRNTTKAHSYITLIDKILEVANDEAQIVFGTLDLNLPLAYEYTTIAKKYHLIKIKPNKVTLSFDYYNRYKDILGDNPADVINKVQALELKYGLLLGIAESNKFIFIDVNNLITFTDISGNVVTPASIVSISDIFKTYFSKEVASKIGFVTEWVDLNLVSKPLPVGFVLAYRYGLVNMLEYLKVPYKLIAKRGNKVLEEGDTSSIPNTTTGNASFTSNSLQADLTKVVDITYGKKWKTDEVKYLNLLDKYHIPKDKCVIGGSAAMLAHRYPGKPNKDLDIIIDESLISELKTKYKFKEDTSRKNSKVLISPCGQLELFSYTDVLGEFYDYDYLKEQGSDLIDGYYFTNIDMLFKFYTKLNRPKDQDKIDWLAKHISGEVSTIPATEDLFTFKDLRQVRLDPDKYRYTPGDIVIKFKDLNLVINRYPLSKSLIVCGLDYFNTQAYNFDDFEKEDVYHLLMTERGIKTNYLKAVDSFFDLFIDPVTQDVLQQMNEPTNVRDLLIRASVLLTTCDHKEASSIANHRIRSYEQFNAIIYNEMARALAAFHANRGKGNTFSVNPNAIYLRIIQNPAFVIVEDVNPIQELKDKSAITFAGIGGRTSESFVIEDRKYPSDGIGVLSESTVDNQKVSMNASLSVDPSIVNTRGLFDIKKVKELDPTNVLSVTALAMPCSTNDDSLQLSHQSAMIG